VRESDVLLAEKLAQLGLQIITQNELDAGMGDNIALAVQASQEADAWVIALADMPWIQIDTLYLVRHTIENSALIAAPIFNGKRGHPVGFNHFFREQLLTLNGDNGAKSLLKNHVAQLQLLSVNDAGILRDVDRREDCLLSSSETVKKLKKQ
jgi:molybdenum cofactor cytidylyltransferase